MTLTSMYSAYLSASGLGSVAESREDVKESNSDRIIKTTDELINLELEKKKKKQIKGKREEETGEGRISHLMECSCSFSLERDWLGLE